MPHRCGSPCLGKRGGQGWQEQLLQPGGAGVQLSAGDEQSGRGARPGGHVLATGFYPPRVTCFSLSALCSTMDSRTATSPAMESSSGQRVSAWGAWGGEPVLGHAPHWGCHSPCSCQHPEGTSPWSVPASHPGPHLPASSPAHAGVNTGAVGSYIYDKDPEAKNQP